jgi:hypothetical protein
MQLQVIKAIIAAAWVFAAIGIMVGPDHLTLIDRLTLAFMAVVPPVAMWFWWTEPLPAMGENIHDVRNGRTGAPERRVAEGQAR